MSKLKTNKSARKRFNVSGQKKLMRRPTRQNHFNARATGQATRNKHGYVPSPVNGDRSMRKVLPYI